MPARPATRNWWPALAATGALDFVRRLPKGMDHLILEGGLGLSGGQRQALVLSRLLVRQPQVQVLKR